jgi:hypothetical protein
MKELLFRAGPVAGARRIARNAPLGIRAFLEKTGAWFKRY